MTITEDLATAAVERMSASTDALTRAVTSFDRRLEVIEDRTAPVRIEVREPRTYGPDNPHLSWLQDLVTVAVEPTPLAAMMYWNSGAQERLARHGQEVGFEIRKGTAEGRRAERVIRSRNRDASGDLRARRREVDEEIRAVSTGTSSMGSLTPPQYLLDMAGWYHSPIAAFANQCHPFALPEVGMSVDFPVVGTPTSVAVQAGENTLLTETNPVSGFVACPVVTVAGRETVSQQYFDRVGPGVTGEVVIATQLAEQFHASMDSYALGVALAGATQFTNSGTAGTPTFWDSVGEAAASIAAVPGLRSYPSHTFVDPVYGAWLMSRLDSSNRPVWPATPATAGATAAAVDSVTAGFSGYNVLGTKLFFDGNMPTTNGGADVSVVVADLNQGVWLGQDDLIIEAFVEPSAAQLSVVIRARAYAAAASRYPGGVVQISGSAFPAAPTF
jgi:HK97 family phage major capsid protein